MCEQIVFHSSPPTDTRHRRLTASRTSPACNTFPKTSFLLTPLYQKVNIIPRCPRHKKKNNDVQCNKSTSARLSKFRLTGY